MTQLNSDQLVELVEQRYFHNVDSKNIDPVLECFAEDAVLTVQTAGVTHRGRDGAIRKMFEGFMGDIKRHCQTNDNQVEFVILAFPGNPQKLAILRN